MFLSMVSFSSLRYSFTVPKLAAMVTTGDVALTTDKRGVLISCGEKMVIPVAKSETRRIAKFVLRDLTDARISLFRFSSLLKTISGCVGVFIGGSKVTLIESKSL